MDQIEVFSNKTPVNCSRYPDMCRPLVRIGLEEQGEKTVLTSLFTNEFQRVISLA